METVWNIWAAENWVISVQQPVVGKHMPVRPAVRKTHEADKEQNEEEKEWEVTSGGRWSFFFKGAHFCQI